MEIIRHRTNIYRGLPPKTVDDPSMNLAALGMLVTFLRYQGTDEVTPSSVASQNGMGPKTRVKTMSILQNSGYIAAFQVQESTGSWAARMVVSDTPMTPDEVEAHADAMLAGGDILWIRRMDATWKEIPGTLRKATSVNV